MSELVELFLNLLFEFRHAGIGLFDHGQRDGAAPVRGDHALSFAGMFDHTRQFFEPKQPAVDFEEDVLDIVLSAYCRPELDVVLVFAVAYGEATERDIRSFESLLDIVHRDTGLSEFGLVGQHEQFGRDAPAQVDHGHFGELLDAFGDDLGGEAAQRGKLLGYGEQFVPVGGRVFVAQGEIDVESGNVGCTRLDDLRAFQVARQRGDGAVDFLIDFDEEVVDIASLFERQTDDAVSFARFAAQIHQLRQLNELLTQRCDDRFVELACRDTLRGNLDRDIGCIDVGHERDRQ